MVPYVSVTSSALTFSTRVLYPRQNCLSSVLLHLLPQAVAVSAISAFHGMIEHTLHLVLYFYSLPY